MEHFKLFEEFIFEIGGGTAKPYDVYNKARGRKTSLMLYDRYYSFFKTDSGLTYNVVIENSLKYLTVDFGIVDEERYPDSLNRGEMWRIMATIKGEVKKVWEDTDDLNGIRYNPKASDNDLEDAHGEKRDRLYRLMINSFAKENRLQVNYKVIGGYVYANLT